jgi:hypothetical protein
MTKCRKGCKCAYCTFVNTVGNAVADYYESGRGDIAADVISVMSTCIAAEVEGSIDPEYYEDMLDEMMGGILDTVKKMKMHRKKIKSKSKFN